MRERAIALRREGKSRREIQAAPGLIGRSTLNELLQGEPPPEWTRRPNAKDELRAQARELRTDGLNYNRIAARLGVSKSSVSRRSAEGVRKYWAAERKLREARHANKRAAAAAEIGELTEREILIAGVIAYWCEGAKAKPHRQPYCVVFINSDPGLVRLFLRFLDAAGDVSRSDLVHTVCIHESGDTAAAQQFWQEVTGAGVEQFNKPSLKRHNPKTTRKNVGVDYHGCLRIGVHHSSALLRKIEGWAQAIMANPTVDEGQVSNLPS